jgi:2,5-furandicarboxylate decarboxylase 1
MSLREFLAKTRQEGALVTIAREVDPYLEMARIISALDGQPVLFEKVKGSDYRIVSGLCSQRAYFALDLGVPQEQLLFVLAGAYANPVPPMTVETAACQEVIERDVDLNRIPILTHMQADGGPYVTAGVTVIQDPGFGRNACFHRLMRLDERRFAARIVEGRGTHTALGKVVGDLEVAICLGVSLPTLLAAAMSPPLGVDELSIANALRPAPLVKCVTKDLQVPAEAEIVLEGRITRQTVDEGPFLDLTETWDVVRQQPVVEIDCITHRRNPIYHADEGRRASKAAFRGHGSLKHVTVVDEDVNLFDPHDVEWAVATRFQADRDLMIFEDQPSSSLDPSALYVPGQKARTAKMGLDATIPWRTRDGRLRSEKERAAFRRVGYQTVDVEEYLSR